MTRKSYYPMAPAAQRVSLAKICALWNAATFTRSHLPYTIGPPLQQAVQRVLTERDLQRAVYDCPKDQLVSPWIEANIRFGRIPLS